MAFFVRHHMFRPPPVVVVMLKNINYLCSGTIALIHLSVEMNPNAMQCSVVKCTALQCILLRTPFSLHRLDHKVNYGDWQGAAGKSGDQMEEVPFPRMKHRHGRWLYIEQVAEVWGTTLFNIPFHIIQSNEGLILHKQFGIFDDSSLQLYFSHS